MPKKLRDPETPDEIIEERLALRYVGIRDRVKKYGYSNETAEAIAFIKVLADYGGKN